MTREPVRSQGSERTRTAVPAPSTDSVYVGRSATLTAGEVESAGRTENVSEPTAGGDSRGTRPTGVAPSPAVSAVAGQDEAVSGGAEGAA